MLAACRSPNIVRYYASVLPRGSANLAIAMELMAASAADLVSLELSSLPAKWILTARKIFQRARTFWQHLRRRPGELSAGGVQKLHTYAY